MLECSSGSLRWLQFCHLSEIKKLSHGIFLRHGGYSKDNVGTLNLGGATKDSDENVIANRKLAQESLGLNSLFEGYQCHQDDVIDASWETIHQPSLMGDSLVTHEPNLGLMIKHSDCQAAIFYDPILHVLANVHCGWRGSTKNIYQKTILHMKKKYGTNPANLLVGISPSLGPEAAEFRNYLTELPNAFWEFQIRPTYFDFWEISKKQLMDAGILENHIEISRICTYSNPQNWFSYRYDRNCGRNATIVALL